MRVSVSDLNKYCIVSWTAFRKRVQTRRSLLTTVIYYAPRIFEQIGLVGNTIGLLATGVVGIVNFVMTIPAVLFVDNFGRRPMLAIGEFNMAISHATIAAIIAVYGGRFGEHKAAGNGAVFMVYWYVPHLTT